MKKSGREPVSLGSAIKKYLARIDTGGHLDEAAIARYWTDVVGAHIGEHTLVRGLREGELLVVVDSPVWATELSAMSEELKSRLREKTGKDSVKSIRFTVSRMVEDDLSRKREARESARRYGGDKVEPVPLTNEERAIVERSIESIQDLELREIALRATVRDLEWKKGIEAAKRP